MVRYLEAMDRRRSDRGTEDGYQWPEDDQDEDGGTEGSETDEDTAPPPQEIEDVRWDQLGGVPRFWRQTNGQPDAEAK